MPLAVNTNTAAMQASFNLGRANESLRKSLGRLSSGKRINSSGDDAGGLAVATKINSKAMRTQATRTNVGNAISLMQTQDGVLEGLGKMLDRMAELRVMAGDVTKNAKDVEAYSKEFVELQKQIGQSYNESFNGVSLFTNNKDTWYWGDADGDRIPNAWEEDPSRVYDQEIPVTDTYYYGNGGSAGFTLSKEQLEAQNKAAFASKTLPWSRSASDPYRSDTDGDGVDDYGDSNPMVADPSEAGINPSPMPIWEAYFAEKGNRWNKGEMIMKTEMGHQSLPRVNMQNIVSLGQLDTSFVNWNFSGTGADGGKELNLGNINGYNSEYGTSGAGGARTSIFTDDGFLKDIRFVSIGQFTNAIQSLANARAEVGAHLQRLHFTSDFLMSSQIGLEATHGRIMDADIAHESMLFARQNVLVQGGAAMAAQANQLTNIALTLLA